MSALRHETHYHTLSESEVLRRYYEERYRCEDDCTPMDTWLKSAAREVARKQMERRAAAGIAPPVLKAPHLLLLPSIQEEESPAPPPEMARADPKKKNPLRRLFGLVKSGKGLSALARAVLLAEQSAVLGVGGNDATEYTTRLRRVIEELEKD